MLRRQHTPKRKGFLERTRGYKVMAAFSSPNRREAASKRTTCQCVYRHLEKNKYNIYININKHTWLVAMLLNLLRVNPSTLAFPAIDRRLILCRPDNVPKKSAMTAAIYNSCQHILHNRVQPREKILFVFVFVFVWFFVFLVVVVVVFGVWFRARHPVSLIEKDPKYEVDEEVGLSRTQSSTCR